MSCALGNIQAKKRLFISLLIVSLIALSVIFFGIWKISYLGLQSIHEFLPAAFGAVLMVIVLLQGWGIFSVVAGVKGWKIPQLFYRQTYWLLNMLFYVVLGAGRVLRIDRRRIEASFVAVSNAVIRNCHLKVTADRLLVLTPHCLQLASCPHKITRDPNNCKRCGGCDVGALVTMAEEMGFHFFVLTGGTLARQTVKKIRPQAIVAIACERDLTSGIQDVYPIPSVGVMNIRPNGPCYNTHVDLAEFREAIEAIIDKDTIGKKTDNKE